MNFDCDAWLNKPTQGRRIGSFEGRPLHEFICYLVVANGGFEVLGWGFLSYGGGHNRGLEQDEALHLIALGSYMSGLYAAGVPIYQAFEPYFNTYVAKLEKENHDEPTPTQRPEPGESADRGGKPARLPGTAPRPEPGGGAAS